MELMFYIGEYDLSPVRAKRLIDRVSSWRVSELPKSFRIDMTMKEINDEVNAIPYKREVKDHWKSPDEFFHDREDDCEGYCVAKYALMIKILSQDPELMGVLVGDDIDRITHALLLVQRKRGGLVFVLDNRTPIIHNIKGLEKWFRPIYFVNEEEVWLYS